jgi:hypothetical protein
MADVPLVSLYSHEGSMEMTDDWMPDAGCWMLDAGLEGVEVA